MKSIRLRQYGQEEWTTLQIRGEQENILFPVICAALETVAPEDMHIQVWYGQEWEDVQ